MAFNAADHLIDIKGKDYLEVKWRLVWLREDKPEWSIQTTILSTADPVIIRADILNETGRIIASGHAEYPRGKPFPAVMKCETAAIGRALAHAGFGTQWAGVDVEEGDVVDAPVSRAPVSRTPPATIAPAADSDFAESVKLAAAINDAKVRDDLRAVADHIKGIPAGSKAGSRLRKLYLDKWDTLPEPTPESRAAEGNGAAEDMETYDRAPLPAPKAPARRAPAKRTPVKAPVK